MATYAIGDVQGCYDELQALLGKVRFRPSVDRLWFVGDLVNRGPKSLEVLRWVRDRGERAVVVLGNHDLHLITQFEGVEKRRADDTLDDVLDAPDAAELVDWLRNRPMLHAEGPHVLVHAGLLPEWTVDQARELASEVERALRGRGYREFLENLYGSKPTRWSDSLKGWDRLRVIVNAMTRMRFVSSEGEMDFRAKGNSAPKGFAPWFEMPSAREGIQVVFGHWSARGLQTGADYAGLDSGCVWGGALTALRLEDGTLFQVECEGYQEPGGEG